MDLCRFSSVALARSTVSKLQKSLRKGLCSRIGISHPNADVKSVMQAKQELEKRGATPSWPVWSIQVALGGASKRHLCKSEVPGLAAP